MERYSNSGCTDLFLHFAVKKLLLFAERFLFLNHSRSIFARTVFGNLPLFDKFDFIHHENGGFFMLKICYDNIDNSP